MKKFVLVIFLVGFCKVFGSFEFDILGQLTASTSFPIAANTNSPDGKSSTAANFGVSLQIGNQYSIRKVINDKPMEAPIMNSMSIKNQTSPKELKAVSVLLDIRLENETINLGKNLNLNGQPLSNAGYNMTTITGLNLGAGITTKFIIGSVNSLVPRDIILGFSLGAKLLVNLFSVDVALFGSGVFPVITPYIDLFVEQRFFVARKFALVGGINIGADIMIAQNYDLADLLSKRNVMAYYPSFNIGVSLGMHFGN